VRPSTARCARAQDEALSAIKQSILILKRARSARLEDRKGGSAVSYRSRLSPGCGSVL